MNVYTIHAEMVLFVYDYQITDSRTYSMMYSVHVYLLFSRITGISALGRGCINGTRCISSTSV